MLVMSWSGRKKKFCPDFLLRWLSALTGFRQRHHRGVTFPEEGIS